MPPAALVRACFQPSSGVRCLALACAIPFLLLATGGAAAQSSEERSGFNNPTQHFEVDRPAELSNQSALSIYLRVLDDMAAGYRLSGDADAGGYRMWRRYNKTPYRSATHGERFVNNYANTVAKDYGRFEAAGKMPVGSVLAKDSFAVTSNGDVFLGPLFLMEKMASGFNPPSGDWRYSMVMPDGSLFGRTKGDGSAKVEFCITCHRAAQEANDHMFFVPKEMRVER